MIKTITKYSFINEFQNSDRRKEFSYAGLKALFEYLEEAEDKTNPIKLDIISLCCDFSEYEDINEYLKDYQTDLNKEDYDTTEEYHEAVKEEISDKTLLINIDDESFIIQQY